jgi:hypothetical protein
LWFPQILILQRSVKGPKLTPGDRLLWVWLCTLARLAIRRFHRESLHRLALAAPPCLSPIVDMEHSAWQGGAAGGENHLKSMESVDFFAVPTIRFQVLYVFLVLAPLHKR